MSLIHRSKGASLIEYGLLVGLIAVTAISAVNQLGNKVAVVFDGVSDELAVAQAQTVQADIIFDVSGTDFLVFGDGGSAMVAGQSRVITVRNGMSQPTLDLVAQIQNGRNFIITSDGCSGKKLAPGASCKVTLQAQANSNGGFQDALRIYY
jgi:Flp pilus assembly pilin Flp